MSNKAASVMLKRRKDKFWPKRKLVKLKRSVLPPQCLWRWEDDSSILGLLVVFTLSFCLDNMASKDENSVHEPHAYNKKHLRPRIWGFGVMGGYLPPESMHAITDVKGVCVGHKRVIVISTIVYDSKRYVSWFIVSSWAILTTNLLCLHTKVQYATTTTVV